MFTLSGIFYIIAFVYGLVYVKEVPKEIEPAPESKPEKTDIERKKSIQGEPTPKKGFLADFFDLQHVYDTFRIAFRSDQKYRRLKVVLIMCIVFIIFGPQHGTHDDAFKINCSNRWTMIN